MTDDQHGEGTPQGGGRWDPLPQGDYDDGATAFVKLPEGGIDALLSGDSPLAAPGHGYVPPQITATPPAHDGTGPGTADAWGTPAGGTQWPDPNAVPAQEPGAGDRFTYNPAATGQWNFGDANTPDQAPAPGHDVTGQWSIPVAGGDLPDESGEYSTSALLEQWGGTPPATLPGGAPAPWATGAGGATGQPWGQQETAPSADPYAQTPGPYDSAAGAAEAERYASAADMALGEAQAAAEATSTAAGYDGYADAPAPPGPADTFAGHGPADGEAGYGQGTGEQPLPAPGPGTGYDTAHNSMDGATGGFPERAQARFPDEPSAGFPDAPTGPEQPDAGSPHGSVPGAQGGPSGGPDGSTSGPQGDAPSGFPGGAALGAEGQASSGSPEGSTFEYEGGASSGSPDGSAFGHEGGASSDSGDGPVFEYEGGASAGVPGGSPLGAEGQASSGSPDGSAFEREGGASSGSRDGSVFGHEGGASSGSPGGSDSGDQVDVTADFPDGEGSHPLPPERTGPEPVSGSTEGAGASPGSPDGAADGYVGEATSASPGEAGSPSRGEAADSPDDAADAVDTAHAADAVDATPADGTDASPELPVPTDSATPHDAPAPPQEEHPLASYVLSVNGADRPVTDAWIGESLLYVLRERLGLAGAKDGCSQGECGACNVQVDGRLVASCLVPAVTAAGSEVRTVEGLAVDGRPSDVQRALARCGAVQCGFCVPGMAMTVHDLLEGNPAPTELETRQALCGNLCRCSGYRGVLEAVKEVVAGREAHTAADGETDADEARIPHQAGPGAGGVHPSAFDSPGFPSANAPTGPQGTAHPPGPHDQAYGQDGGQA